MPGLWMPAAAMQLLGRRLAAAGYGVGCFAYAGRASFDENLRRLCAFLDGRSAHLIGHSLGGVLIVEMLNAHRDIPVASAVLLGAPARGCRAGRRFGTGHIGRWMMGGCGVLWREREAVWKREAPLGVIAGTMPIGLGRVFGRLPGANDGVVRVEETVVDGMTERVLVPVGHSLLIVSGAVARLVERFVSSGRFA